MYLLSGTMAQQDGDAVREIVEKHIKVRGRDPRCLTEGVALAACDRGFSTSCKRKKRAWIEIEEAIGVTSADLRRPAPTPTADVGEADLAGQESPTDPRRGGCGLGNRPWRGGARSWRRRVRRRGLIGLQAAHRELARVQDWQRLQVYFLHLHPGSLCGVARR